MWARWLAAIVLGLPLSTGVVGLAVLLWPGPLQQHTLAWLVCSFPVWIAAMACAFACRSGLRAWLWMGGATAACYLALAALKALGWMEPTA